MGQTQQLSQAAYDRLKEEYTNLTSAGRIDIARKIETARELGDLSENGDYHAAKEEQARIESRIIEINDLIARANVIDVTKLEKKDTVIFGATVELINLDNKEKKTYKIVGKDEADLAKNFIYYKSPIGKALIGKNKKNLISFTTPSGEKNFEIKEIKYI